MKQVEELLERLMRDPDSRDQYIADPDKYMAEAGLSGEERAVLQQVDVEALSQGACGDQRRTAGVDDAAMRGGSVMS